MQLCGVKTTFDFKPVTHGLFLRIGQFETTPLLSFLTVLTILKKLGGQKTTDFI